MSFFSIMSKSYANDEEVGEKSQRGKIGQRRHWRVLRRTHSKASIGARHGPILKYQKYLISQ